MSATLIGMFAKKRTSCDLRMKPKIDQAFADCIRACISQFWEWGLVVWEDDQQILYRFYDESACRNRAEMLAEEGVKCEVKYLGKDGR